jgi:DNA-binding MarR family transcriptional regulator
LVTPEEVLQELFRLTVAMSGAMEEDLAARRLTRARATLMTLLHHQGPMMQTALARAVRVSRRNITGLVDGLEASGLATRSPHPSDGRALLVALTPRGTKAAAALSRDERAFARYLFTNLTAAELQQLADGLQRLLTRLDEPAFTALRASALRRWPLDRH